MKNKQYTAIFAADHRDSFARLFDRANQERLSYYKQLLARAYLAACDQCGAHTYFLSDVHYGYEALRLTARSGSAIVVPLETSGTNSFVFDEKNLVQIRELAPDAYKCLIRLSRNQTKKQLVQMLPQLKKAADFALASYGYLIIEIIIAPDMDGLVLPETSALDIIFTLDFLVTSGVRPDFWKLPGHISKKYYDEFERYFAATNHLAKVLILGADEPMDSVITQLALAREYDFFAGFAIGRSLWKKELLDLASGKITEKTAIDAIAANFHACCLVLAQ